MVPLKEEDHSAVKGSDMELPAQEDAVLEQPYRTADRTHVDALLDISEEVFLNEKEPHEFHCYSGLEESVSESMPSAFKTVAPVVRKF